MDLSQSGPTISIPEGSKQPHRSGDSRNFSLNEDTHSLSTFGLDTVDISGLDGRTMTCTRHQSRDLNSESLGSLSVFGTDRVSISGLGQEALRCNFRR